MTVISENVYLLRYVEKLRRMVEHFDIIFCLCGALLNVYYYYFISENYAPVRILRTGQPPLCLRPPLLRITRGEDYC